MTLKEEIKNIFNNRPKHKNKQQEKADASESYGDVKSMRHASKISLYPHASRYRIALIVMCLIASAFLVMLMVVDALPSDLTFILIAVMLGMIVLCSILFASNIKRKRILGVVISLLFCVLFFGSIGYMTSTFAMLNRISDTGTDATGPKAKTVDVTTEPFNIYITGIDQWAAEKGEDLERSDVNMLVTVNPKTKKILLTSIPRDSYVELYTAKQMDKLTHTGIYGVEETLNTVENWLGIDINYYVKMNFTGMCAIVDALDGIDVYSPVDFESSLKGYEYKKGMNHLYGRKALYFARERKSFEGQDSIRVENQQRVVKAIIKKMTSSTTILTKYGDVMDAAGENLTTNMSTDEMRSLVKMQITEIPTWDVETQKIEGEYDQDYVASLTQSQKFDIYRPDEKSVKSVKDNVKTVMNPSDEVVSEANKKRTKSFIVNIIKRATSGEKKDDEE